MSMTKYDVETGQPITSFAKYFFKVFVSAFLNATISLLAVRDWDTGKEKKYFFSVQVFLIIPMEQLELVENPFSTRT